MTRGGIASATAPGASSTGSGQAERRLLALVGAVQFVNVLDFVMVMPLGPDFARALGIPNASLGLVGAAYTGAAALSGVVGAFVLDRFDRRNALAVSIQVDPRRRAPASASRAFALAKEDAPMWLYPSLLFVHLVGAVLWFAATAAEAVSLVALRRTESAADARTWLGLLAWPFRVGPAAMLAILASGMGMMRMTWGNQAWLVTAFLALVGMGAVGGLVSARAVRRLRAELAAEDAPGLSAAFRASRARPALGTALLLRAALGIGALALMSFKPGALASWILLVAAALGGLVAAQARFAARSMSGQTSGS